MLVLISSGALWTRGHALCSSRSGARWAQEKRHRFMEERYGRSGHQSFCPLKAQLSVTPPHWPIHDNFYHAHVPRGGRSFGSISRGSISDAFCLPR